MENEKKNQKIIIALIGLLLVFAGLSAYFYYQTASLKKNSPSAGQEKAEDIIKNVSRLIVLPEGEEPTVATVADPEQLKDQVFFAKAKAGDKVLIYTNAKKAILYDPIADKIVEVSPLNIETKP